MGLPIARNIAFKARSSVYLQLHSRTKSKLKIISEDMQADGVTCALRLHDKYSSMSKWCDILILCLKDQAAAEHVLLSAGGGGEDSPLLSPQSARQGQIIIDHTTAAVPFAKHCGQLAAQLGVHYLDAPLSGSPRQAFQNQLVTMIGSNANQLNAGEDVVQRLYPILNMYCDHIHSMGESGAGQATKLVSAALVASHNSAAAEAMTMAHRLNLEYSSYPKSNAPNRQDSFTHSFLNQNALIKVLDASWASSTMLRRNASTMQDIIRNPDQLPPTSGLTVDHLLQDLQYLDDTLRQAHPPAADGGSGRPVPGARRLPPHVGVRQER
ncbi:3-hydroxyisobutyrate dehydrogenase [Angomonas deanei]|nr:3-hydroxyisobutyrate dehydrogenase [Angomonas deanei]|eukprot:EPY26996.1 3-hydroxyisobutyrate dehydrogenase [Angomonas deanei]